MGRAAKGAGKEKHHIKKMDRLLGNPHLSCNRTAVFAALAGVLLSNCRRPIIVVDWTPWREGFHAITAGLAVGGRCIVFYGEVHPERLLNNPAIHHRFLDMVASMLPPRSVPLILTDAGFRTSWIDDVERRGWDYVARVRGRTLYLDEQTLQWEPLARLRAKATTKPRSLGKVSLNMSKPRRRRVVLVRRRKRRARKGRRAEIRSTPGVAERRGHMNNVSTNDGYYRRRAEEPWVCAYRPDVNARIALA